MLGSDLLIPLRYTPAVVTVTVVDAVAGIDIDQTAVDLAVFAIPFKCSVHEAGVLVTETCAGTTPGVVDFDLRPTAGSDSSRGAADIAHLLMGTTAAGKVLYDKVAVGTILYPGQEVVVQLTTQPVTGAAGHIRPYLLVKQIAETDANLTAKVLTA